MVACSLSELSLSPKKESMAEGDAEMERLKRSSSWIPAEGTRLEKLGIASSSFVVPSRVISESLPLFISRKTCNCCSNSARCCPKFLT
jgi:hypothetical protein